MFDFLNLLKDSLLLSLIFSLKLFLNHLQLSVNLLLLLLVKTINQYENYPNLHLKGTMLIINLLHMFQVKQEQIFLLFLSPLLLLLHILIVLLSDQNLLLLQLLVLVLQKLLLHLQHLLSFLVLYLSFHLNLLLKVFSLILYLLFFLLFILYYLLLLLFNYLLLQFLVLLNFLHSLLVVELFGHFLVLLKLKVQRLSQSYLWVVLSSRLNLTWH